MTQQNNVFTLSHVCKKYRLQGQYFSADQSEVQALSDISCAIPHNTIFGVVGESGSGKSTLMRLLIGLEKPSSGSILFGGDFNLVSASPQKIRKYQSQVKLIFQDPARSLNHRLTVHSLLLGSLWYSPTFRDECILLGLESKASIKDEINNRIIHNLRKVGLDESILNRYPTEFSGGQRQRIAIVRALIHKPEVLICDEITASLDMSTRKSIIDLLISLKDTMNLSIIFVAHDLSLVLYLCDDLMVLSNGQLKELSSAQQVLTNPQSRDTKRLLEALPKILF